jgi:hypothetical protein
LATSFASTQLGEKSCNATKSFTSTISPKNSCPVFITFDCIDVYVGTKEDHTIGVIYPAETSSSKKDQAVKSVKA